MLEWSCWSFCNYRTWESFFSFGAPSPISRELAEEECPLISRVIAKKINSFISTFIVCLLYLVAHHVGLERERVTHRFIKDSTHGIPKFTPKWTLFYACKMSRCIFLKSIKEMRLNCAAILWERSFSQKSSQCTLQANRRQIIWEKRANLPEKWQEGRSIACIKWGDRLDLSWKIAF